jgi:hypothetical protein
MIALRLKFHLLSGGIFFFDFRFSILNGVWPRIGTGPCDELRAALRLHSAAAAFPERVLRDRIEIVREVTF